MVRLVKHETNLYQVLERLLRKSGRVPLTCVDLFDDADVKRLAGDVEKVSDTLGYLWRRGYLTRIPAPKVPLNQSKWSYTWSAEDPKVESARAMTSAAIPAGIKPRVHISEKDGAVTLEFPQFIVTVQPKK